jgi:hypothetical protein
MSWFNDADRFVKKFKEHIAKKDLTDVEKNRAIGFVSAVYKTWKDVATANPNGGDMLSTIIKSFEAHMEFVDIPKDVKKFIDLSVEAGLEAVEEMAKEDQHGSD